MSFMCEVLDVSRAGYYAWVKREQSVREREDVEFVSIQGSG